MSTGRERAQNLFRHTGAVIDRWPVSTHTGQWTAEQIADLQVNDPEAFWQGIAFNLYHVILDLDDEMQRALAARDVPKTNVQIIGPSENPVSEDETM